MNLRPGSQRCQCRACGEFFRSVSGFDRHRIGPFDQTRRCLTPDEMLAKGLERDGKGMWVRGRRTGHEWAAGRAQFAQKATDQASQGLGSGVGGSEADLQNVPKVA